MENTNVQALSWAERFALIDHFNPNDAVICHTLGIPLDELQTARQLRESGSFETAHLMFDPTLYNGVFQEVVTKDVVEHAVSGKNIPVEEVKPVKQKSKRGRNPGDKRALAEKLFLENHETMYRSQIVKLVEEKLDITFTNAGVYVYACEKRTGKLAKRGHAPKV
ncbi:MAG: hypothetical protein ACREAU_01265 [Nitrosopumilaceae archaeon]